MRRHGETQEREKKHRAKKDTDPVTPSSAAVVIRSMSLDSPAGMYGFVLRERLEVGVEIFHGAAERDASDHQEEIGHAAFGLALGEGQHRESRRVRELRKKLVHLRPRLEI